MIKLLDLIKEISQQPLTPKEQQIVDDILLSLHEGEGNSFLDKVKEYAKKGAITATILTALMASPQISKAQKDQINNIVNTSVSIPRNGTQVDGINGQFTSQFKFPNSYLKDLNTGKTDTLNRKNIKPFAPTITVKQMAEWNNFVEWMKQKGYSGNNKMDNISFSNDVLEEYKKENPNFWVNSSNDIKSIQSSIKSYRQYIIDQWEKGKANITIGGKDLKPGVDTTERFMAWAK